jgi:hypothetical protein
MRIRHARSALWTYLLHPSQEADTPATVEIQPLLLKPQWMNGLSERLLVSHYVNNYGG